MQVIYGFVSEPHKKGQHLIFPATKEGGSVRCHDLAGFFGSWEMKEGGVFFPSISGETFCTEAMDMANTHSREMNKCK